jgi:hypothetical protein
MPKLGRPEEWLSMEQANVQDMYMNRVQSMKNQDLGIGWYQDGSGDLYHFDGKVWDAVPERFTKGLEYLG